MKTYKNHTIPRGMIEKMRLFENHKAIRGVIYAPDMSTICRPETMFSRTSAYHARNGCCFRAPLSFPEHRRERIEEFAGCAFFCLTNSVKVVLVIPYALNIFLSKILEPETPTNMLCLFYISIYIIIIRISGIHREGRFVEAVLTGNTYYWDYANRYCCL